jgi:cation:H+ antiporter
MPEFITSITSTISLGIPELAFGNVFGSNIFNITILAVADLFFLKHMFFNKVKTQRTTNLLVIIMYVTFLIPLLLQMVSSAGYHTFTFAFLLTFNVASIVIIVIYFLSIRSMSLDETEQSEKGSDMSFKKIGIMFGLWALVVVASSFFVTIVANDLGVLLGLDSSFAGAIFLGVATSLPEFTAVITLMKLKNYEAALGNIVGSNVFNLTIISVVDVLNFNDDIFVMVFDGNNPSKNVPLLLILGLINSIILMFALLRRKAYNKFTYVIPSVLILVVYFFYIGMSL